MFLIAKPILILTVIILNIIQLTKYVIIQDLMDRIIKDGCVDEYVASLIGYGYVLNRAYYNTAFVYAPLGISIGQFVLDQNFYKFMKKMIKYIFCCKCIKK